MQSLPDADVAGTLTGPATHDKQIVSPRTTGITGITGHPFAASHRNGHQQGNCSGWCHSVSATSAGNEDYDRIAGLEVGADNYVVKPRELVARINAILGRAHVAPARAAETASTTISFGRWRLQQRGKCLVSTCGELRRKLTSAEYELLMVFLCHPVWR